jgi:hypothetical protein
MLDAEKAIYTARVHEWSRDHEGQFVVVRGTDVLGFFGTMDAALGSAAAKYGATSFLVRRVGQESASISIPALTLGILRADA